jgi:hypothetical protein
MLSGCLCGVWLLFYAEGGIYDSLPAAPPLLLLAPLLTASSSPIHSSARGLRGGESACCNLLLDDMAEDHETKRESWWISRMIGSWRGDRCVCHNCGESPRVVSVASLPSFTLCNCAGCCIVSVQLFVRVRAGVACAGMVGGT